MSAPPKEQPIITNLEADEAKMHLGLKEKLKATGHPGETKPAHEEHPLTGTLKELGPWVITGMKEGLGGVERDSRDRVSKNENITSIYEAREDKKEAA